MKNGQGRMIWFTAVCSLLALVAMPASAQDGPVTIMQLSESIAAQALAVDRLWIVIAGAMVFLMQAGFLCFEVGVCREKNATAMAIKNLIDWIVLSLAFFLVGFAIMFGSSSTGFFGTDFFLLDELPSDGLGGIFFMFQLAFAGTALTIVSGTMSERTAFIPYLLASVMMGALIYPVFGHWAWGNLFVESNEPWLASMGFMDFAGSTVVHSVGAWVGLVGAVLVGRRLGRYDENGKMVPFKPHSMALAGLGVVILWFGWWGFNGGSTLSMDDTVGPIILNTNLSAAAAGMTAFFHCFFFQNKEGLTEKMMGGVLGGLVAITACCNVVTPMGAVCVGLSAGVIHNLGFKFLIEKLKIDDPVGAIPVHGVCGVWGTLCVAIFGQAELLALPRFEQLGVQVVGIVTCFVWSISIAIPMFMILKKVVGLRVSPDVEQQGIDIASEFEHEVEVLDADLIALLQGQLDSANAGADANEKES